MKTTTVTVTKDVWEELSQLKLDWKKPTLSEVIAKLINLEKTLPDALNDENQHIEKEDAGKNGLLE